MEKGWKPECLSPLHDTESHQNDTQKRQPAPMLQQKKHFQLNEGNQWGVPWVSVTEMWDLQAPPQCCSMWWLQKKNKLNEFKCIWSYKRTEKIQTTATWSLLRYKTNPYPWNCFFRNKGHLFWQLSNKIIPISDLSETEQNLIKSSKCVQLPVTLKFHF